MYLRGTLDLSALSYSFRILIFKHVGVIPNASVRSFRTFLYLLWNEHEECKDKQVVPVQMTHEVFEGLPVGEESFFGGQNEQNAAQSLQLLLDRLIWHVNCE